VINSLSRTHAHAQSRTQFLILQNVFPLPLQSYRLRVGSYPECFHGWTLISWHWRIIHVLLDWTSTGPCRLSKMMSLRTNLRVFRTKMAAVTNLSVACAAGVRYNRHAVNLLRTTLSDTSFQDFYRSNGQRQLLSLNQIISLKISEAYQIDYVEPDATYTIDHGCIAAPLAKRHSCDRTNYCQQHCERLPQETLFWTSCTRTVSCRY